MPLKRRWVSTSPSTQNIPKPTMIVSWCPNCQHNVGTLGVCPVCNAACHNVRVVKCVACEGKGRNSKGRACYPCEGKGHRGVVK